MKEFTAEYSLKGQYGRGICTEDTIEDLFTTLLMRGYEFENGEKEQIIKWSKTTQKKYYGSRLDIRRGKLEMTEYTSF